jgi:hypothetical protein
MIKICPTCGDFYADASLLFCPSDGTPLADVSTHDETWAEATRVVEEKERVLKRKTRRLKLRRAVMTTMTVLITTMAVCVLVANTYIYLAPQTDAPVVVAVTPRPSPKHSETPAPTPTPTPAPKCTGDDKRRIRDEIVARYSAAWEEAIGSERDAIVRAYAPDGAVRPGRRHAEESRRLRRREPHRRSSG